MHSISILIKPASSLCNLNCSYCFYEDVSDNRETKSYGYMSTEVAKEIIDNTLNSKDFQEVTFAFQGGEPMLIGLDFYKWFIEYCKKNQGNKSLNFVIQTNGVLINDDWAVFFKENGFLVGISIDGFKENHDFARYKRGAGTFDEVFAGVNLLKKHKIRRKIEYYATK